MAYKRISPQPVVEGGTGITTITSYAPVCGGTTGTGNFQAADSGISNVGYFLMSNGAGALPTWSATNAVEILAGDVGAATGATVSVIGDGVISTSGSGATLTISVGGATPMPVTKGGIQQTSLTTYAPLCGGTTSTGALQQATTGISNSGYILTSNDAGALPSWQDKTTGTLNTINGNSGSAAVTAAGVITVNFTTNHGTPRFTASGSTNQLAISDGNNNISLGSGSYSSTGSQNIALGNLALGASLTTTTKNVILGQSAYSSGASNPTNNVVIGKSAMSSGLNATFMVALGTSSGSSNNTGSSCVYFYNVGASESHKCRIGSSTGTGSSQLNAAFISGIQTIIVTGVAMLVSSANQLGVASSSERFKTNIIDMADASSPILDSRPVTFKYISDTKKDNQYGLIAEELEALVPDLIIYGDDGLPMTIQYHNLCSLLLNEMQKLLKKIEILEAQLV